MCCCLEREESGKVSMKETIKNNAAMASDIMNFLIAVQYRIQRYCGVKLNMMIQRDAEARDDDADGLVGEMDNDKKKAAFGLLRKATGSRYERIRKTIKL
eukprot:11029605-Ditylum_brightwellii.AAC.1